MSVAYDESMAMAIALAESKEDHNNFESALALSSALYESTLSESTLSESTLTTEEQMDPFDSSLDEAIAQSLHMVEMKEIAKVKGDDQPKVPNIKTATHILHDAKWVVATGYSDGSAVVNATFVWAAGRDPVADIKAGNIVGQAPYCFLITLFHLNMEFFLNKGIVSPYALSTYLTKQGLPPVPNQMYFDDTILPVAQHFAASIYVNIVDLDKLSHSINDLPSNKVMLMVTLAIRSRHYISGLEK